ncbi:MAG TPA: cyclase family protein [Caulobacterales bacterium]|nr:cyclase family protein [Caulobacterales bacterium]
MQQADGPRNPRWRRRPEHSTWGDFGPDDELGRLNLLTPQKLLEGVAEVREGLNFCLSLPLDLPGGNALASTRFPPRLKPMGSESAPTMNFRMNRMTPGATDVVCDDAVELCLQYSTQWDALSHVGQMFDLDGEGRVEKAYYNGWRGGDDIVDPHAAKFNGKSVGAHRMGIDRMAVKAIQGRAVLIDLAKHFGETPVLVGFEELARILEEDHVVVEEGDILCLYTGFADMILAMGGEPDRHRLHNSCASLNGRDQRLLDWITRSGIAAITADNFAVEAHPAAPCAHGAETFSVLPLHDHCLFRLGVPLGELWYFGELGPALRARGRSRFFLTAPPLRLPRAVGSPVTPVGAI